MLKGSGEMLKGSCEMTSDAVGFKDQIKETNGDVISNKHTQKGERRGNEEEMNER